MIVSRRSRQRWLQLSRLQSYCLFVSYWFLYPTGLYPTVFCINCNCAVYNPTVCLFPTVFCINCNCSVCNPTVCLYPTVLYPTVFCINCNCPVCNPPPKDTATKDAQDTRITLISVFSWLCYLIFFYFCIFQYSSDAFHQTDLFIGWRYSSNQSGGTRCRTYAKGESFCTFVVIVFLVYLFVYGLFSHQDYV